MTCHGCGFKAERFVPAVETQDTELVYRFYCVGCFAELVFDELDDDEDAGGQRTQANDP